MGSQTGVNNQDHKDPQQRRRLFKNFPLLLYPWTTPSAVNGISEIIRGYDSTTRDHATRNAFETLPGYDTEGFTLYGYRRYNLLPTSLVYLGPFGGVTVGSNAVAGGSVWSWVWNGMPSSFINTWDFGREMQSALFPSDNSNPTEAGDTHSNPLFDVQDRSGSPLYSLSNNGNTQSSLAIPLEFNPQNFGGGYGPSFDQPVIWKDVLIGKDLTLNFNNMGPVAQYSTQLHLPNSLQGAQIEIPSIYVTGNFNLYWTYDAAAQALTQVTIPDGCATGLGYPYVIHGTNEFGYGGVIVSDSANLSTSHAMGIYGVETGSGGSVTYFTLWNFTNPQETNSCGSQAPGTGTGDFSASKLSAVYGPGNISAGVNTYHTWVMTGSINDVTSYMRSLYSAGVE